MKTSKLKAAELVVWLDTVQLTKPFSLDDVSELYEMIKKAAPDRCTIDVYWTRGDVVHVRVAYDLDVIERDIPIA